MNESKNLRTELTESNEGIEINIVEIFHLLKRKILFIIAAAVLFAGIAGIYSKFFVVPQYKAEAAIYVDGDYTQAEANVAISLATNIAKDYPYLIKSRNIMNQVSENLNLGVSAGKLISATEVVIPSEEAIRVLYISVTYSDPEKAAAIANELVDVVTVELPKFAKYARISISPYDPAVVPTSPVSPNVTRNALVAGIFGAVLVAAIFVVMSLLDDKIKSEADIEKHLGLNMLAAVPDYSEEADKRRLDIRKVLNDKLKLNSKSSEKRSAPSSKTQNKAKAKEEAALQKNKASEAQTKKNSNAKEEK